MPDVTLKKLAEMLSLSISTVSRALKDHPDISTETKQKVKELSEILEYEPNTYAINLRTNNSRELGIIIPTISNDFYQSFIGSLEEEARLIGYSLIMLQSGDDPVIELENLKRCKQNRMSGVFVSISSHTTDISGFLKMKNYDMPVIFFDKVPASEACNKVCLNDVKAAAMAADIIIKKGRKHIVALFGDPNLSITQKRLTAFKETFISRQYDSDIFIFHASSTNSSFEHAMRYLTAGEKPEVIFCMSDEILIGVMKCMQTLELKVPDDTSILAISEGIVPNYYYPKITYVETSGYKLAKTAFLKMMDCLAGDRYSAEIMIDPVLVEGGSI